MALIREYIRSFVHLFFPEVCRCCDNTLYQYEDILCLECLYHLPFTDFHEDKENDSAKQLWGKLDVSYVTSMLHLTKSSRVETLLHKLKYNNSPEIGLFLGNLYAKKIQHLFVEEPIDFIIPVPIHQTKLAKRGYNQAAKFAEGLEAGLNIPCLREALVRTKYAPSQILMDRNSRYDNVKGAFKINSALNKDLNGKHILLVDDVLTTGATLSEAGQVLLQLGAQLSVVTIARA